MMLRVADKPRVYLVGQQVLNTHEVKRFLDDEIAYKTIRPKPGFPSGWQQSYRDARPTDAELLIELGGRLCYNSFGEKQGRGFSEDYIKNIMESKHGSVLEHAYFNFLIADVSRGLSHELVRHRPFALSQQSSRYVEAIHEAVYPPQLEGRSVATRQDWEFAIERAFLSQEELTELYADETDNTTIASGASRLAQRKAAREVGRTAMPTAAVTRIMVSGNAREWRWFLQLRGNAGAEPEIRRLTTFILPHLKIAAPFIFADMDVAIREDEKPGISYEYYKV